jgi:hypothetical protein
MVMPLLDANWHQRLTVAYNQSVLFLEAIRTVSAKWNSQPLRMAAVAGGLRTRLSEALKRRGSSVVVPSENPIKWAMSTMCNGIYNLEDPDLQGLALASFSTPSV